MMMQQSDRQILSIETINDDRQIDRQIDTDNQINIDIDRQINRQSDRQINLDRYKQID